MYYRNDNMPVMPDVLIVGEPYPNPSSASIRTTMILPDSGNPVEVEMTAFNILGQPVRSLLSASLPGEMVEEYTDPEIIYERFENLVDFVIDGGIGGMTPSTVVDCTSNDWSIIRQGAGVWEE